MKRSSLYRLYIILYNADALTSDQDIVKCSIREDNGDLKTAYVIYLRAMS